MRHGRGCRSSVPMFLTGREPDHITRPDLLDWPACALGPSATRRDNESLTERMCVPCSPRTRLKGYAGALDKCRIGRLKEWINAYGAREPIGRSFTGGL